MTSICLDSFECSCTSNQLVGEVSLTAFIVDLIMSSRGYSVLANQNKLLCFLVIFTVFIGWIGVTAILVIRLAITVGLSARRRIIRIVLALLLLRVLRIALLLLLLLLLGIIRWRVIRNLATTMLRLAYRDNGPLLVMVIGIFALIQNDASAFLVSTTL
jgi:hypothetical protein